MADFDHEIISRGNCMICGKPIDIDNIFLCSDCLKKQKLPVDTIGETQSKRQDEE